MAVTSRNTKEDSRSARFPRQDIGEAKKNPKTKSGLKWCKENVDYAIEIFKRRARRDHDRLTRNYKAYNGVRDKKKTRYLTHTYGKRNFGNFVDYRLGRSKIDLLEGEWLRTPLNAIVEVINRDAKSKKLDLIYARNGLRAAAKEVEKLRNEIGVDVFNGMKIPEEDENVDAKLMNEKLMQLALNYQIKKEDLKTNFNAAWKDTIINSEAFGKVELESDGRVIFKKIDPRDSIYLESDNDPFLKRGPIWGHRERMFVHDIISKFGNVLTEEQRTKINQMAGETNTYLTGSDGYKYYDTINNELTVDVFFVEWKSVKAVHTKVSPDKKNPEGEPFKKDFSDDFYDKNYKKIMKDVKKGKYKIETNWREVIWEGVRIGQDIYVNFRKLPYQIQRRENGVKYRAMSSYSGLLFNTVDGIRVSFVELLDNISFLYNVVMYQINREISKLKGKVILYDEAFLPRKKKVQDVLRGIINDGIITINSAQEGNRFKSSIEIQGQIKEIDLGISQSFQQLVNIKINLEDTIDRLSGVNENREGQIAASSTASNAISAINASRSITLPMFYMFGRYTEEVLTRVAEKTKLSWVYLNPDEGRRVIGDSGHGFYEVTTEFAHDDYSAFIGDGLKDRELRDKMEVAATTSLNAKEITTADYGDFLMEETTAGAIQKLREGWDKVKEIQARDIQMRNQGLQQQTEASIAAAKEDREDKQQHDKDMAILDKSLESMAETQKAKNEVVKEEQITETKED